MTRREQATSLNNSPTHPQTPNLLSQPVFVMVSTQFFSTASVFVATSIALMHLSGVAAAAHSSFSSLHRRDFAQGTDGQLTQACLPVGEPPCSCPTDLNGDSGVMINLYPGYQCAYPGGACTWDDIVRGLFIPRILKFLSVNQMYADYLAHCSAQIGWSTPEHAPDELPQDFCMRWPLHLPHRQQRR